MSGLRVSFVNSARLLHIMRLHIMTSLVKGSCFVATLLLFLCAIQSVTLWPTINSSGVNGRLTLHD